MTRMIEIIGQIGKSATEEEIQEYLNREDKTDERENMQNLH